MYIVIRNYACDRCWPFANPQVPLFLSFRTSAFGWSRMIQLLVSQPGVLQACLSWRDTQGLLRSSDREPGLLELFDHVDHGRVHRFEKRAWVNPDSEDSNGKW